ncbi:Stigma-specific Stig1 family protein [Quillaja saponaria]|uniref:Stigma-specific Stig1 family protein n=1 Tax=Quillaja saponaria TaxID=32244 RepID=A0AAD7PN63_QUISA|nr:Stigma-specific Stig1 family protein [Quillaja saponaria]
MELIKIIFMIAITMALSITITMKSISQEVVEDPVLVQYAIPKEKSKNNNNNISLLPSNRVTRFLAEENINSKPRNPNAADHCHKDNEICNLLEGKNSTCCNNKCMDLSTDNHNCGACKRKCKFTQQCCRGECVQWSYDKRHCGACNHRCNPNEYCVYGLCNYA